MKTITISTSTAHNLKNRYHKFLKVCDLFNSKMQFEAGNHYFDLRTHSEIIESLSGSEKLALHITGEDEGQAALLIKSCIDC